MILGLMSDGILSGSVSDMHRVRTSTTVLELDTCVSLFGVCCEVTFV